ncbi:Suppressor of Sensor Kinase (SLN1), partial [Spiromyces aspiralis]
MAKPHTPMIRRLWDSVMHTLAEFWQMVVEYPFMIRAIHLEYHHRQFCEFVARKRHSEINSEDIVSLYNDPLLSFRPPPGKDGQAAAAKSDPATSARRPPRSSVTTPSELERYDDSSDAGNLTATVLPRRRPRSHSSSHHNREDDACRKKLQQPLVYNPGIIHMQCTDECDPLENVFSCFLLIFSSLGLITRHLEDNELEKCRRRLVELCTEWCGFIAEDCIVSSEKTFGWTMKVFEAITSLAPQEDISHMPDQEWELLKARVAGCLRVLIFHFDVLGARSEKRKMQRREQVVRETEELRSLILSFTRESSENPASVTTTSNTPDTDVEK